MTSQVRIEQPPAVVPPDPMKIIELRRHTDNDGDQLTDEGITAAEQIGHRLHPPYDMFVSSGAARASQTVRIWRSAVGGQAPVEEQTRLRSRHEDRWREAYKSAGSGELARMRDADPELVREDSATLAAALHEIFDRLPDGGRALAVGHSPTNEAAVLGLTGEFVDPIDKGAGVLVIQEAGSYRVEPVT